MSQHNFNFEILEDGSSFAEKSLIGKEVKIGGLENMEDPMAESKLSQCYNELLESEAIYEQAEQKAQEMQKAEMYIVPFISSDYIEIKNTTGEYAVQTGATPGNNKMSDKAVQQYLLPNTTIVASSVFLTAKTPDENELPYYHPSSDWLSEDLGYGTFDNVSINWAGFEDKETNVDVYGGLIRMTKLDEATQQKKSYYRLNIRRSDQFYDLEGAEIREPLNSKIVVFIATKTKLFFNFPKYQWSSLESGWEDAVLQKGQVTHVEKEQGYYYKIELTPGCKKGTDLGKIYYHLQPRLDLLFRSEDGSDFPFSMDIEATDITWWKREDFTKTFEYGIKSLTWIRDGVRTIVLNSVPGRDYNGKVTIRYNSTTKAEAEVQIKKGSKLVTLPEGTDPSGAINKLDYNVTYNNPWSPPVEDEDVASTDTGIVTFTLACTGVSDVELSEASPLTFSYVWGSSYASAMQVQYRGLDNKIHTVSAKLGVTKGSTAVTVVDGPTDIARAAYVIIKLDKSKI